MPRPPPQRPRRRHIPQENLLVPSHAGESRVILRDGDVEDFVAVGGICLDQTRVRGGGGGFGGVVETDGAVGGTG
ncbi:MAG: hypothetical protein Q9213_005006 [Squamulea squamosa]